MSFGGVDPYLEAHYDAAFQSLQVQVRRLRNTLPRSTAANVASLGRNYPTLPPEITVPAGILGLQAGMSGMQNLALEYSQMEAEDEQSFLESIPGYGMFRKTVKGAFTVFDTLWEEGLARPFRTVVATLGLSDQDLFFKPWDAWKQAGTSFGVDAVFRLLRGEDVDIGEGFIPQGDIVTQARERANTNLTMFGGRSISPGQFAAQALVAADHFIPGGTFFEQGGTAYNLVSGFLDATAQLATLKMARLPARLVPGTWPNRIPIIGGKATGLTERVMPEIIAGRRVPLLGDPAAALIGGWSRLRKAAYTPMTAELAAATPTSTLPGMAGLRRGLRRFVHHPATEDWTTFPEARRYAEIVDATNETRFAPVWDSLTAANPNLDAAAYQALARSGTTYPAIQVFQDLAKRDVLKRIPGAVGRASPFQGAISRPAGRLAAGMLTPHLAPELRSLYKDLGELGGFKVAVKGSLQTSALGRAFTLMPHPFLHIDDVDRGLRDVNQWSHHSGLSAVQRSRILLRWATEVSAETGHVHAYDVAREMLEMSAENMRGYVPKPIVDHIVSQFADQEAWHAFLIDKMGQVAYDPAGRYRIVNIDTGTGTMVPAVQLETEFATRFLPMPDPREMRKALSATRRKLLTTGPEGAKVSVLGAGTPPTGKAAVRFWLKSPGKDITTPIELNENIVQRVGDFYMNRFWKPATLLRVAWPVRVIMEEQLRMAAAGYDSLFNHPFRFLSWMMADPKAGSFGRAAAKFGIRPRGAALTDIRFGADLLPDQYKLFTELAKTGDTVEDAQKAIRAAGMEADDLDVIGKIRDEAFTEEDLLIAATREYRDAVHSYGGWMTGQYGDPSVNAVWTGFRVDDPNYFQYWAANLLEPASDRLATKIAELGKEEAVRWLSAPAGRNWLRETIAATNDPGSRKFLTAALHGDTQVAQQMVNSRWGRIGTLTGRDARGTIKRVNPETGAEELFEFTGPKRQGTELPKDVFEDLQDPAQIGRIHQWVDPHINPDNEVLARELEAFIATRRVQDLQIGETLGKDDLASFAKILSTRYRPIAPYMVKGPKDPGAGMDFWQRFIRTMFNTFMGDPTHILSRGPVMRQGTFRYMEEMLDFAGPEVLDRVEQAFRNADLGEGTMRRISERIAEIKARPGRGVLNDTDQAFADRILRVHGETNEQLVGRIVDSGLLDDLDMVTDPEALEVWFRARIEQLGEDGLTDSELALHEYWSRIRQDRPGFKAADIADLEETVARVKGLDITAEGEELRYIAQRILVDGVSRKQLAAELGVSPSTISRRLDKARRLAEKGDPAVILDPITGRIAGLLDANEPMRRLELFADRFTDMVDGQRHVMKPYGFEDIRNAAGEIVEDGFEEYVGYALARALQETEDLLYDTSKRHGIMDMMRLVWPFGEAFIEVTSRWLKFAFGENPNVWRRGQQVIEGAREQGFFYQNANGDEVFNYPGAGLMFNAAMNATKQGPGAVFQAAVGGAAAGAAMAGPAAPFGAIAGGIAGAGTMALGGNLGLMIPGVGGTFGAGGEAAGGRFGLEGQVQGLNIIGGNFLPGFGPVVQVLASHLLGDDPTWDPIREIVLPFGDQKLNTPQDFIGLTLPRWMTRFLSAVGMDDPDNERLLANLTMNVYSMLVVTEGAPGTPAQQEALLDEAKRYAGRLYLYQSYARFFSPTVPQFTFEARDKDGDLWLFQTLGSEYQRLLDTASGDEVQAFDAFVHRFGLDPTLFANPKSALIAPRQTTISGDRWARANADLYDKAPATAYWANPDKPTDESFVYEAYLRQLEDDTRQGLTPEQWLARRNDTLGRIVYEKARREADIRFASPAERQVMLRMVKGWLIQEYPGYARPIVGMPERYSLDQKIEEIRREWFGQRPAGNWATGETRWGGGYGGGDERLRESDTGQALAKYLRMVDYLTEKAVGMGLTADGMWMAESAYPLRETLRRYAGVLMGEHPDFTYIYRSLLEHQFNNADDELYALGVSA